MPLHKPVSLTQNPCSTSANSTQPKVPHRKNSLNWHQEQAASNATANYRAIPPWGAHSC